MALDRTVGIKVKVEGEGDEDLLQKQAKALDELEGAAEKVVPACEEMGSQIARSAGGAQRSVEGAKAALDGYREAIAAGQDAGLDISEEALANVAQLEKEYQGAVDGVGQF